MRAALAASPPLRRVAVHARAVVTNVVLAQESNACLVLTWSYAPHRAKDCLGCLWLFGRCCMAGGLRGLKPTPNVSPSGRRLIWQAKALFA